MKLPNFLEDEAFNQLRKKMGTSRYGYFKLFNPKYHLTGQERSLLELQGKKVSIRNLVPLADSTWAFKNTRVILYLPESSVYHLAQCQKLKQHEYVYISTKREGDLPLIKQETRTASLKICEHCLQVLGYKGFDLRKNRKVAYSQKILQEFSRSEFFRLYRQYPINIEALLEKQANITQNLTPVLSQRQHRRLKNTF
ncbi:hypothetical protein SAMN05421831_1044 [Allopseudospirillum japonicum]|uniref:Uncharacterized protein n=1 Tax=Allopseudospirillum japonicum TaxID=64971 RepID=A0A1H6RED0_9GAMM|nr:hypothetical protein [Allopseudospirillum japonicum]SEI54208.1 hypothetical protein SAMN05421831_1044 [Allopseudospirillum japonicum]